MTSTHTLATFLPPDAERITLVPQVQQRDWRRRGFLPASNGRVQFNLFALADMLALKVLAERIGPTDAVKLAPVCARAIAWHALGHRAAYAGDGLPGTAAAIEASVALLKAEPTRASLDNFIQTEAGWGARADELRRAIWLDRGLSRVIPARFFIWWPTGEETWQDSVDSAVSGLAPNDARLQGPMLVLDQHALGRSLVDRAPGAFIQVGSTKGT